MRQILGARPGTPVATILQAGRCGSAHQASFAERLHALGPGSSTPMCGGEWRPPISGRPMPLMAAYNLWLPRPSRRNLPGADWTACPILSSRKSLFPQPRKGIQYNVRVDYGSGKNIFSANTFLTFLNTLSADASAASHAMADLIDRRSSVPAGFCRGCERFRRPC